MAKKRVNSRKLRWTKSFRITGCQVVGRVKKVGKSRKLFPKVGKK